MDFNAKTVFPSFKQRFNNSAHSHSGLQIADKVPMHDVGKHVRSLAKWFPSPSDYALTELVIFIFIF